MRSQPVPDKKSLWAVDPFATDLRGQVHVLKGLSKLVRSSQVAIEPVAVVSPDQVRIPVVAFMSKKEDIHGAALQSIQRIAKLAGVKTLAPVLLSQESHSLRASVRTLVGYARETGADLIAAGTTTRKTIERFLMGSFAEQLVLETGVPIYLVGHKVNITSPVQKILFATDYSEKSYTAFLRILDTAKSRKAKLIAYYKIEYAVPAATFGFDATPVYDEYWKEELQQKKRTSEKWFLAAKNAGVKMEAVFDDRSGFVTDSILAQAKKQKAQAIALASESGRVEAALLGSVCRQVLRQARCPVWVLHIDS